MLVVVAVQSQLSIGPLRLVGDMYPPHTRDRSVAFRRPQQLVNDGSTVQMRRLAMRYRKEYIK